MRDIERLRLQIQVLHDELERRQQQRMLLLEAIKLLSKALNMERVEQCEQAEACAEAAQDQVLKCIAMEYKGIRERDSTP